MLNTAAHGAKTVFLRQMCIMLNDILFQASSILTVQALFFYENMKKYKQFFLATVHVCDSQLINQSISLQIMIDQYTTQILTSRQQTDHSQSVIKKRAA